MSTRYRTLLQFTGTGYSSELQAIINRANLEGFIIPAEATLLSIDVLIEAMKASGYWGKRDLILNFCYNDINCRRFSMINWKNPSGALAQEVNLYYNLLPRSEEFENSNWSRISCTFIANNTTAPDGNLTADLFTATATTIRLQGTTNIINSILIGNKYNLSIYAKAGTKDIVLLRDQLNSPNGASFNLTTVTATAIGNGINATITAESYGFYRCSVDIIATGTNINFGISGGVTLGTMWLWGAQLTEGYGLRPYQQTSASYSALQYDAIGFFGSIPQGASVPLTYYIRTGFNPSVGINQYTLNNASRDVVIHSYVSTNNYLDSAEATVNNLIRFGSSTTELRVNQGANNPVSSLDTSGYGYVAINRINSTNLTLIKQATVLNTTANSTSIYNGEQWIYASLNRNNAGRYKYYSMGAEVVVDGQLFRTAYNNYLTAIGLSPIA